MSNSGKLINDALEKRGLNKTDLARLAGKSRQAVSSQLKDTADKEMAYSIFERYADLLDFDVVLRDRRGGDNIGDGGARKDDLCVTIKITGAKLVIEEDDPQCS